MSWFRWDKEHNQLAIGNGFDISWWHNWTEIFHRQNWYNFTFIRAEFEYAPYKDVIELSLGLIGFNICLSYYNPKYIERIEEEFEALRKLNQSDTKD